MGGVARRRQKILAKEATIITERIGFIGLGDMGKGMVRNLQNNGFQLNLFGIAPARESVDLARSTKFHDKDFSALLGHWCGRAGVKAPRL